MKKRLWLWICLAILTLFLVTSTPTARAALDAFGMDWWTLDSGGGVSSSDIYTINDTIGQADTGSMSGGNYTLEGGFWSSKSPPGINWSLYLPVLSR